MRSRPAPVAATAVAASVVVCALVCASVFAALPALAGTVSAQAGPTVPPWLQRLNDVRVSAGVAAASENTSWTTGIQHHLTYLEQTDPALRTGQYASVHTENPASPYYTSDGALEGSRSNLVKDASQTSTSAVDYWLGAPFHAIGMLRAGLQQTAFAQDGTYAGMDVISGLSSGVQATAPVLFPGPGSTTSLTAYAGHESPDPIETCRSTKAGADYSSPGLPIIAMLTTAPTNYLTATLTTPSGASLSSKDADVCIVDETTYVSTDSVYGPTGKQILTNDHAVLIVPRTRLVAGTYAVRITQSKQADIAWSFVVVTGTTSTSPPTSAATTTAPTTTAPTTTAPTTTTPASTAPPAALSPVVTTSGVTCSFGTRASGSAELTITNPADGAGEATYSVALVSRTAAASAADGSSVTLDLSALPPGPASGSVSGSDGSSATFAVDVPTCPRYEGVRVHLRVLRHHRVRILLDNTRNGAATLFRIRVGAATAPHLVAAARSATLRLPFHHATRIRVSVTGHVVARARVGP
jgi:hypothetical protein